MMEQASNKFEILINHTCQVVISHLPQSRLPLMAIFAHSEKKKTYNQRVQLLPMENFFPFLDHLWNGFCGSTMLNQKSKASKRESRVWSTCRSPMICNCCFSSASLKLSCPNII